MEKKAMPTDECIEQWWAEGKNQDPKFWHDAPYRTNGDVVEEIKTAIKYFIGTWQQTTNPVEGDVEKDIIQGTKEFAKNNNLHFDNSTESMILNAIREYASRRKEGDAVGFLEWVAGKNYHQLNGTILFRQAESDGIEHFTVTQLYYLYKEEMKKP